MTILSAKGEGKGVIRYADELYPCIMVGVGAGPEEALYFDNVTSPCGLVQLLALYTYGTRGMRHVIIALDKKKTNPV